MYEAVLRLFTEPTIKYFGNIDRATLLDPFQQMQELMRRLCTHAHNHPQMIPLLARELNSPDDLAQPVRRMLDRLLPQVLRIVEAGQQSGHIRAGEPSLIRPHLSLASVQHPPLAKSPENHLAEDASYPAPRGRSPL